MLKERLKEYIEKNILPKYTEFDKAHDLNHVQQVIQNSLEMAKEYQLDENIIYTAAAYHDLGLEIEREKHEEYSRDFFMADKMLDEFFSLEEKEIIANAILTHRASSKVEPSDLYGKVIADADNDLDPGRIVERMVLYSLDHYENLNRDQHLLRCISHGHEKYGHEGYLSLYLDSKNNLDNLAKIREILDDEREFENFFDFYYNKHKGKEL